MPESKKVPMKENKKNFKNKGLFKRFNINLETFEIEKSDFGESDDEYNKESIHNLTNKNSYPEEETLNKFKDEFELTSENKDLSVEIKEKTFEDSKKKFSIVSLFGLAIGLFFIITGVLIFLGNSDKVVDNVISGETSASSVLLGIIGMIFIALSLLKIFPRKKAFGNIFRTIQDFESEINENDESNLKHLDKDFRDNEVETHLKIDSKQK